MLQCSFCSVVSNVDYKTRLYNSLHQNSKKMWHLFISADSWLHVLFWQASWWHNKVQIKCFVLITNHTHPEHACMDYIVMRHSYHINTVQIRGFQHHQWWMSFLSRSCTLRSVASKVENFSSRWLAMWSLPSRASLVFARCSFMLHGMKNHKQTRQEVKFEQFPQMFTSNRAECPNFQFIFVPEPRLNQMSRQMCAGKYWKWLRLAGSCFHSAC